MNDRQVATMRDKHECTGGTLLIFHINVSFAQGNHEQRISVIKDPF
jgi:hypothetical protein